MNFTQGDLWIIDSFFTVSGELSATQNEIQRQEDSSLIVMFENSNLETCLNFNFSDSNLGGCCMSYTNIYTAYINMWCQNIW